uniref:Hypoxanthine phosphoribosyltransferase n=1 Tax=uncultured bacterium fosmid pJB84G2 TaxID=1478072 RepID=A0A0H3U897_9BACT|nr:hypothetical protein [uncultured bacterium fosmid pJB84G2]
MLLDKDVERIFFTRDEIEARCKVLGAQITKDYHDSNPILVGILRGCIPFMEALERNIDLYCSIDYIICSSYQGTESTGLVNIVKNVSEDVTGKDIILIEDIVDTGLTIKVVKEMLISKGAKSVKIASLLEKIGTHMYDIEVDYKGFDVANEFVVGFGLDYNQYYRNLPYIGVLKKEIYEK